ncbi:hypothetical protein QTP70_005495 [Hemibagrus guttatus]|uniref:Adenylosuccinate synthetase n=1 Tax=Hemibagrus guttatus TaxID=175788 RepID=A0AAE0RGW9_9TELE|nr:hypothetical protein QTP70_005495 [Hemibagrus guttatus]
MPEPPQLATLDVGEQWLYSELLPGDKAPYPISKGATCHPTEETHFGRWYLGSCPFGHDPKLMTIDKGSTEARTSPSLGNKVTVVLGAQWGDEGKGKVVDLLAQDADMVCRCQFQCDSF